MNMSHASLLRRFAKDISGGTAVVMTISAVPVVAAMGISLDLARAQNTKTELQAAADTAALAGAISFRASNSSTTAQTAAANAFDAAKGTLNATVTINTVDSTSGKATFAVQSTQNNMFMAIMGPSKGQTTIAARAEVTAPSAAAGDLGKNLEVALMLDVTVSMSQNSGTPNLTKIDAMKQAAKSLIDTVVHTSQTPYKSRVALVPFSSAVNVGTRFRAFTGSNPTSNWTSVVERGGAYAFTADAPGALSYFPSFRSRRSSALGSAGFYTRNLNSNVPSNAFVTPLSSDKSTMKTAINAYTTAGSTAGHLGTAFAWYALSPGWASIWGTSGAPAEYDATKTLKVAVLMSDFEFNTHYQSGNGDSSAQAAQLCTNMKAAGVEVYTIGFQVDANNTTAMNLFTNCATSGDHKIAASNGEQMIAAFNTIATTVVEKASNSSKMYLSN